MSVEEDIVFLRRFREFVVNQPAEGYKPIGARGDERYQSRYLDPTKRSVVQSSYPPANSDGRHWLSIAMPIDTKFEPLYVKNADGESVVDPNALHPVNVADALQRVIEHHGVKVLDSAKLGNSLGNATNYVEMRVRPEAYEKGMQIIDTLINPDSGTHEQIAQKIYNIRVSKAPAAPVKEVFPQNRLDYRFGELKEIPEWTSKVTPQNPYHNDVFNGYTRSKDSSPTFAISSISNFADVKPESTTMSGAPVSKAQPNFSNNFQHPYEAANALSLDGSDLVLNGRPISQTAMRELSNNFDFQEGRFGGHGQLDIDNSNRKLAQDLIAAKSSLQGIINQISGVVSRQDIARQLDAAHQLGTPLPSAAEIARTKGYGLPTKNQDTYNINPIVPKSPSETVTMSLNSTSANSVAGKNTGNTSELAPRPLIPPMKSESAPVLSQPLKTEYSMTLKKGSPAYKPTETVTSKSDAKPLLPPAPLNAAAETFAGNASELAPRPATPAPIAELQGPVSMGITQSKVNRSVGGSGTAIGLYGLNEQLRGPDRAADLAYGRESSANASLAGNAAAVGFGAAGAATSNIAASTMLNRAGLAAAAVGTGFEMKTAHDAADGYRMSHAIGGFTGAVAGSAVGGKISTAVATPIPHPVAKGVVAGSGYVAGGLVGATLGSTLSEKAIGEHLQGEYDKVTKGKIDELNKTTQSYAEKMSQVNAGVAPAQEFNSKLGNFAKTLEAAEKAPNRAEGMKALEASQKELQTAADKVNQNSGLSHEDWTKLYDARNNAEKLLGSETLRRVPEGETKSEEVRQKNIEQIQGNYKQLSEALQSDRVVSHAYPRATAYNDLAKEAVNGYGIKSATQAIEKSGYKVNSGDGLAQAQTAHEHNMSKLTERVEHLDPVPKGDSAAALPPIEPKAPVMSDLLTPKQGKDPSYLNFLDQRPSAAPEVRKALPYAEPQSEKAAAPAAPAAAPKVGAVEPPAGLSSGALASVQEQKARLEGGKVNLADNGKTTPDKPQVEKNAEPNKGADISRTT